MKRSIYIAFTLATAFLITSCENDMDNYDAPNGGISGTIYDSLTKEPIPLPVQGSSGVMINLYEQDTNATKSVDFRAKQDGAFENSQVFNCKYRIVVNGPFVDDCEGYVTVNGQTQFDLEATPYSRIDIQATVDADNKVNITYTATPSSTAYTIGEVSVLWNFAPGIDVNNNNYAGIASTQQTSGSYTFDLKNDDVFNTNHYKIVGNENKIYVRVAANVNGIINYSKVVTLQVK
ncbi:MAG: DUF3823 domain-containing protein [Tannerellaceae bacterium]|nr:DUF3823 domain-containing protein [Tannerellaceae bacterium]